MPKNEIGLPLVHMLFPVLRKRFPCTASRFIVLSFVVLGGFIFANRNWLSSRYPLQMDANGYYIYLPAIFVYHDLHTLSFVDAMPAQFDRKYFLYPGNNGGYMTKYTPGMALLELPFFGVAHVLAPLTGFAADGYSPPYRLAVAISTLFYTCLGLWFLARFLARYFSRSTVLWTVALTLFATNLLFYSTLQGGITHNYVFCTLAITLFYADAWKNSRRWQHFALSCAGVGMSALIRPTEVLVGAIPLAILVNTCFSDSFSFSSVRKSLPAVVAGGFVFGLFLLPIFVYWKFATGHWVAYTYEQEGFYFDRPWQLWLGLFGFRKGWFIYTPLLFLAAWGLRYMVADQRLHHIKAAFWGYMPINLYIVLSWYGWWYGGCFGLRALIPALALMAVPLASLFEQALNNSRRLGLLCLAGCMLVVLNVFQSFQYQRQVLHMDAMTWRAYLFIFGKWKLTEAEKTQLKTLLDYPDYNQRGKKLDEYFK